MITFHCRSSKITNQKYKATGNVDKVPPVIQCGNRRYPKDQYEYIVHLHSGIVWLSSILTEQNLFVLLYGLYIEPLPKIFFYNFPISNLSQTSPKGSYLIGD